MEELDEQAMTAAQYQQMQLAQQQAAAQGQQPQQPQQNQYNSESDEEFQDDGFSEDPQNPGMIGWIQWFCSLEGHEFLAEVDLEFIKDPFNLKSLQMQLPNLSKDRLRTCLRMVLAPQAPNEEDLTDEAFLELNQESSDLYGLIHARYILTPRGLAKLHQKYLNGAYGTCPRALCDRQKVLPVGLSDSLRTSRFKVYCPRCEEVYLPKARQVNIDGAYFGSSFPHVFLMHYPQTVILPPKIYYYEPKIFGFNVVGKRGSKFFNPPTGNCKLIEDSMQALELEAVKSQMGRVQIKDESAKHPEPSNSHQEAGERTGGKKKNKKNKK